MYNYKAYENITATAPPAATRKVLRGFQRPSSRLCRKRSTSSADRLASMPRFNKEQVLKPWEKRRSNKDGDWTGFIADLYAKLANRTPITLWFMVTWWNYKPTYS